MTNETTSIVLGADDTCTDTVRAALFAALLDLALPVVEHYRSDLFHDAGWIARHVSGPIVFGYGVRDTGTDIGTDVLQYTTHNTRAYRVTLDVSDRGRWTVELDRVK